MILPYRKEYHMYKDIIGFEDEYQISDEGVIKSKDRTCVDSLGRKRFRSGVILKPDVAQNGYYRVTLCKNGKKLQRYVHRLIAIHFIKNDKNLPQINHKDGNKLNNSIDNLEWCTVQENVIHAYKHGLINHVCGENHPNYHKFGSDSKNSKKVICTNIFTGETKLYGSMIETKYDGFTPSEVSRCCNHGGVHKGSIFKLAT